MLAAWGWGGLMPPVSSPLATRRLSSLCLSRIAALAAALSSRKEVLAEHSAEGPWQGSRGNVYVLHCSTHRVLAHGVVRVHGAVAGVAGASARGHGPAGGHGGRHVGGRGGGGLACNISL